MSVGVGALVVGRPASPGPRAARVPPRSRAVRRRRRRSAVAGAVADHDGVLGGVRAGGLDHPPLVLRVDRPSGREHLVDRVRAACARSARRRRCSPCAPRGGGTATRRAATRPTPAARRRARTASSAGSAGTPAIARGEAIRGVVCDRGRRHLDSAGDDTHALEDRYGRVASDLRVSLTDRCNLRCSYCMPAEGLDWLPGDEVLTDDEVVRLVGIGVRLLGIREVRFTGGEPLVRRGLVDIVRRTNELDPRRDVADHQRPRSRPQRPGPRGRRSGPGQRQPRHGPARDVPRDHPARPARTT